MLISYDIPVNNQFYSIFTLFQSLNHSPYKSKFYVHNRIKYYRYCNWIWIFQI